MDAAPLNLARPSDAMYKAEPWVMTAAVRLGVALGISLACAAYGSACASGAPASSILDSGVQRFVPAGGRGGAGAGAGGAGSGGSAGSAGAGSGGSSGSGPTRPPIVIADSGPPVDSGPVDSGPPDAGPTFSCDDGKKNGKETSADCGGSDCDPCADGKSCVTGEDCESENCSSAFTCTTPGCMDMQLNLDETDTDCGGAECPKCVVGKKCKAGEDCMSESCDAMGRCACVPTAMCGAMECGSKPDGCGNMLMCSTCPAGKRCNNSRMCVCDERACNNNCGFLQSRCCKSDGTCGCQGLLSGCG